MESKTLLIVTYPPHTESKTLLIISYLPSHTESKTLLIIAYLSMRKLRRMVAKVGEVVELARNEFGMIWRA